MILDQIQPKPGLLITFEGIDGCGKTTQLKLLQQSLEAKGYETLALREPGGTEISESIRQILLDKEAGQISPNTELLLFLAARSQLVIQEIKPALAQGKLVLCDRFTDSTLAYQGYGRGFDLAWLSQLNDFACAGLKPDLTIFLDLPQDHFLARLAKRDSSEKNRMDLESRDFLQRVHQGFQSLAQAEPERIIRVSTEAEKAQTQKLIQDIVMHKLAGKGV